MNRAFLARLLGSYAWFTPGFLDFNPNHMKITNGGNEPVVATEDAVKAVEPNEEKVDKVEPIPNEEQPHETFNATDLLKDPVLKPKVSEEERSRDREVQQEKFNLALKFNLKKVEKMLDNDEEIEDALNSVPEHLRGHIRGIVSGDALEPKEETKVDPEAVAEKTYQRLEVEKEGQRLFAQIVSENKLTKSEAEQLAQDVIRRKSLGHPLNEAVLDASARLGFSSKIAIKEAEEKALLRGLRALPPEGDPVKKTQKTGYDSNQELMAKRFKNDPKKVYGG